MRRSSATELFQRYADAFARGERPRAREFLERVDEAERSELAELIDRFVGAVPVRDATAEDAAVVAAWVGGEPPLLRLRTERGLRRSEVVDALVAALGLDPSRREKLRLRYHQLETGQLEPARVDRRFWEALAQTFRARVEEVADWAAPPRREPATAVFHRLDAFSARPELAPARRVAEPPDEVDALFGVDPSG